MTTTAERPVLPDDLAQQLRDEAIKRGIIAQNWSKQDIEKYKYDPSLYLKEKMKWSPWRGTDLHPGQQQIIDAYILAIRQQQERLEWESGQKELEELQYWTPDTIIQNWIRIEAGHTVGKTKLASGLVNHFYDCFPPAIGYTFAPTWKQIHDLLWKEIKSDRRNKGLPGRILDLELKQSDNHFVNGVAVADVEGTGSERVQGQHGRFLIFVLDEAEGIPNFVYDSIKSMTSGGVVIVIMLANPRTRTSTFHRLKDLSHVQSFRISCLWHPNVLLNREIVPNSVRRQYVDSMIDTHCEVVKQHVPDDQTFQVKWRPGVIYKPNAEFMFRVMGVAPLSTSANCLIPVGRYYASLARPLNPDDEYCPTATIGIDAAGYGTDAGTIWCRRGMRAWRHSTCSKPTGDQDTSDYVRKTRELIFSLAASGVKEVHVRIDGGGGFGNGIYDSLKRDQELKELLHVFRIRLVHFNGAPHTRKAYADLATEMYADTAESLAGITIMDPPKTLEADLCDRTFKWVNKKGIEVKKLQDKDEFRKEHGGRSPDDGDGLVLAVASESIFTAHIYTAPPVMGELPHASRTPAPRPPSSTSIVGASTMIDHSQLIEQPGGVILPPRRSVRRQI